MNPGLFGESILLIFPGSIWARDKPNTNLRILISRAFTWAYQIFPDHFNSWHKTKQDFDPFILPIGKHFCFWEILSFFPTKYLHFRYLLWFIWRHFNISSKNGQQSMDSFNSIFAKYWANYKFAEIVAEIKLFQYFELISGIFYFG